MVASRWLVLIALSMLLTSCKFPQQFIPGGEQNSVGQADLAREAAKAAQLAREEAEQAAKAAKAAQAEAETAAVAIRSTQASMMAQAEENRAREELRARTAEPAKPVVESKPEVKPEPKVAEAKVEKVEKTHGGKIKKEVVHNTSKKGVKAGKAPAGSPMMIEVSEPLSPQQKAMAALRDSQGGFDPIQAEEEDANNFAERTVKGKKGTPVAKEVAPPAPKRAPASVPGTTRVLERTGKESKEELEARFKRALHLFESKDEEEYVKMVISEPDGVKRLREVYMQRAGVTDGEQRMLARVIKPFDLKGSSVLLVATKETDDQWIYLPSSKQTRKVVVAEKKGAILGSELRYEDFNPSAIRHSTISLLKSERIEGKNYDVFEVKIPAGTSPYEKAWVWIDPKSEMPIQIEYYNGSEKVKKIEFQDYYKVGTIWRPGKLAIKNLKTNRGTDIEISNVKINNGVTADRLTVEALSKAW